MEKIYRVIVSEDGKPAYEGKDFGKALKLFIENFGDWDPLCSRKATLEGYEMDERGKKLHPHIITTVLSREVEKQRAIRDGKFLEGGAEYEISEKEKKLKVTNEQIAEARLEMCVERGH